MIRLLWLILAAYAVAMGSLVTSVVYGVPQLALWAEYAFFGGIVLFCLIKVFKP